MLIYESLYSGLFVTLIRAYCPQRRNVPTNSPQCLVSEKIQFLNLDIPALLQRPWHEFEHNFQIMYRVGMGHKPPIPEKISPEGKGFLSHCLESDPKMRWTASQLLDHSFVKVS